MRAPGGGSTSPVGAAVTDGNHVTFHSTYSGDHACCHWAKAKRACSGLGIVEICAVPLAIAAKRALTTFGSVTFKPFAAIDAALFGSAKKASTASALMAVPIAGGSFDVFGSCTMVGRAAAVTCFVCPPTTTSTPVVAAVARRQGSGCVSSIVFAGGVMPAMRTTGSVGVTNGGIARGLSASGMLPPAGISFDHAAMLEGDVGSGTFAARLATFVCAANVPD